MLSVSCLCGAGRQVLESYRRPSPSLYIADLEEDRHGSGLLLLTYHPIERPTQEYLSSLSAYDCNKSVTRYFCNTCGCHVLKKYLIPHETPKYDLDSEPSTFPSPSIWGLSSSLSTITTAGGDTSRAGSPRKDVSGQATPVGGGVPSLAYDAEVSQRTLASIREGNQRIDQEYSERFVVATGVILESPEHDRIPSDKVSAAQSEVDAVDDGLWPWGPMSRIPNPNGRTLVGTRIHGEEPPSHSIPAFCQCGRVQLKIFRPKQIFQEKGVQYPESPYPDLMYPFKTTPKSTVDNPSKERWYLRQDGTKYLAGMCACRSCRLTSGYEVQNWAFIPRAAIHISLTSRPPSSPFSDDYTPPDPDSFVPLDFGELDRQPAKNPLRSYESSPGVSREFCPGCGATVFWHSKVRPDLMDVSVGLLHAGEGARAESLLDWWQDRCSFAEDAGLGRTGWVMRWSKDLIKGEWNVR